MDITLYIERIEQYESGAMSATDRSAFEAELVSNADLIQARDIFLQANDVIEQGIENKLRHQLQDWAGVANQTPVRTKVVTMNATWVRMAIAANRTEDGGFKSLLARIAANPEHSYYQQVKKLSKELSSVWRKLVD